MRGSRAIGQDRPPLPGDLPELIRPWLAGLGVKDVERGERVLRDIRRPDRPPTLVAGMLRNLEAFLPTCPDAGMALTNLGRYLDACPAAEDILSILALDPRTAEILVQLFSTSQFLSEQMIRSPDLLMWLRTGAERRGRDLLVQELWGTIEASDDPEFCRLALHRFRNREMLRIGYNDIVRGVGLEDITTDLSHLAEACVEAAYRLADRNAAERHGPPVRDDGRPGRFVVLALGKLGGEELNYSSDIDLIYLYDEEGQTRGPRPISAAEYHARVGGEIVRLLSDHSPIGRPYRVDMRLRPDGDQGPLARSIASTVGYYETTGRTWERQALIKCRPIAGDLDLGHAFLRAITPFVYRRYLGAAEIAEIKAMKRRIEARTHSAGEDTLEVKTGRGGIRDVEFVVQFLQLLHGGRHPEVRHTNTLLAMARLEQVGCLAAEERAIMEDTYRFLRRVEHRLQVMYDRQTHRLPSDEEELRVFAIRMGYGPASPWEDPVGPVRRFREAHGGRAELNRRILNHLLHDAFPDDQGVDPVVDLVLDPDPPDDQVVAALARFRFRDTRLAYKNLRALAREDIPFLSGARCRHFLAAIAPRLLQVVAATPDPDMALTNLEKVSASLGAKAVLWELFSFNPPTLRLYVELCATSQFLSEILINNPGMIDDLMDSLVLDRPQSAEAIHRELAELTINAEDLGPILMAFRNKELVRIGTRDILGREPIRDVTRELADVAEAIVDRVARDQWVRKVARHGNPRRSADGARARWAILALGRLGGRELSYHSDLDLVFLYDEDGETSGAPEPVPNVRFFAELAQRILKALGGAEGAGPLYRADARLRPHGASGPLATTLAAFRDYYRSSARAWERLALTRARVVHSRGHFGREVAAAVREILAEPCDRDRLAGDVCRMRRKLEESAGPNDLRRGPGGLFDIEFLLQFLQLRHAPDHPETLHSNAWEALEALREAGLLGDVAHAELVEAYEFRRTIEGRLRIVHNRPVGELPESRDDLLRLARRLNYDAPDPDRAIEALRADLRRQADRTRRLFLEVVGPPS